MRQDIANDPQSVSALLVAGVGGAWALATASALFTYELKGVKDSFKGLKDDMTKLDGKMDTVVAVLAGVPLAFGSMGLAVRQVADGEQLTAFAAATPAQVAALLAGGGFGQYAVALGHLSGAEALLQSEASLRKLGVSGGGAPAAAAGAAGEAGLMPRPPLVGHRSTTTG